MTRRISAKTVLFVAIVALIVASLGYWYYDEYQEAHGDPCDDPTLE